MFRYTVQTPDHVSWLVTGDDDGVTYADPYGPVYHWPDEDEIVAAIESGKVNSEEWVYSHSE